MTDTHPHLLTRAEYARACGVSRQAINARLRAGSLTETVLLDATFIDAQKYPPGRAPGPSRRAPGLPPLPRRPKKPKP